jgi:hypothetical protein
MKTFMYNCNPPVLFISYGSQYWLTIAILRLYLPQETPITGQVAVNK